MTPPTAWMAGLLYDDISTLGPKWIIMNIEMGMAGLPVPDYTTFTYNDENVKRQVIKHTRSTVVAAETKI